MKISTGNSAASFEDIGTRAPLIELADKECQASQEVAMITVTRANGQICRAFVHVCETKSGVCFQIAAKRENARAQSEKEVTGTWFFPRGFVPENIEV